MTFRVTNEGALTHDFTLGDAELQDAHDVEMAEMAGMMMEDEANAFMIESGQTKEMTWHFDEATDLLAGCHIPWSLRQWDESDHHHRELGEALVPPPESHG